MTQIEMRFSEFNAQDLEERLRRADEPSRRAAAARRVFAPELSYGRHRGPATPGFRPAAVVALFYRQEGEWHIPLTLRADHLDDHAGQVSLPGGAREPGETDEQCAMREMDEELGVSDSGIRVIGRLSQLFVFASNFLVQPIVAVTDETPDFMPNPLEVEQLLEVPVTHLLDATNHSTHVITNRAVVYQAPSIVYRNHHIWGATAMMLGELMSVLRESDDERP